MADKNGAFIISLDFEKMWGVRDIVTKQTYGQHILGVHQVIPGLLDSFTRFKIKASFATVGFLFCKDKNELLKFSPAQKPKYEDQNLSPYGQYIETEVGTNENDDKYHYAWSILKMIHETPGQEIGTHTFCHYYCLEPGQDLEDFRADLQSAINIADAWGIKLESIVFPRNQVNAEYLALCREKGILAYRNNEQSWIYLARNARNESLLRRSVRLLDSYLNLSGHHCYTSEYMRSSTPHNIASSRFLRPYSKRLKMFENLRFKRIKDAMTYAAKNNLAYHLWWHPHNFGINQEENFAFLEKILAHYVFLHQKYGFANYTMSELSKRLSANEGF